MSEYQLEIKQIVDYPRCRVYRKFIQSLIADRSIRTNNGCSGLFYFTVLCSYANFRTSYRRLDGVSYTVYPGEWVCRVKEFGPLIVSIDTHGNNLIAENKKLFAERRDPIVEEICEHVHYIK